MSCCIQMWLHCALQTAAPKKWIAYDGQSTEMDTQFTLRATQLKDLYDTIVMSSLEKDERLDALLTLKATVRVSMEQYIYIYIYIYIYMVYMCVCVCVLSESCL